MAARFETKTSRILILFNFALFVQATSALSIVGILGPVSAEWHISAGASALLVTAFGATLATSLVQSKQAGGALAVVSMGISLATVLGVPASAWLAQHVGPRVLYAILTGILIATGALIALFLSDRSRGEKVSPRQAWALLSKPSTFSGLAVIFLITAGPPLSWASCWPRW